MNTSALSTLPPSDPRRDAIIRHARRHFLSAGYSGTRIEPIAREANVSTATLYTYFAGKADLFDAVINDAAKDFIERMKHVRTASGPAREQLMLFAQTYGEFISDTVVRSIFRLVVAERPRFQTVAMRFFEVGRVNFGSDLTDAIEAMRQSGQLKMDNPAWAAGHLMGMIEHPLLFVPMIAGDEVVTRRSIPEIATDAVATFLCRYGVPGASRPEPGPGPALGIALEA